MPSMPAKVSVRGMVGAIPQNSLRVSAMLRGTVTKPVTPLTIYLPVVVVVEATLLVHKDEVPLEKPVPLLPKVFTKNLLTVLRVSKVPIFSSVPLQMPFNKVADSLAP